MEKGRAFISNLDLIPSGQHQHQHHHPSFLLELFFPPVPAPEPEEDSECCILLCPCPCPWLLDFLEDKAPRPCSGIYSGSIWSHRRWRSRLHMNCCSYLKTKINKPVLLSLAKRTKRDAPSVINDYANHITCTAHQIGCNNETQRLRTHLRSAVYPVVQKKLQKANNKQYDAAIQRW